ncbi:MAG: hypothetical protein PHT43_01925 [Anaerolineaceae bacterium]|jgi:hypothetical protein|nr:hypothetical protein [Anaerolineaceae bacterium]
MVKLILTWNIKPGREQDYFSFVLREYLPQINKFGFEVTDAWITVYGEQPQVLLGAVVSSLSKARQLISSEEWNQLNEQLLDYVDDLEVKLTEHKGGFQF